MKMVEEKFIPIRGMGNSVHACEEIEKEYVKVEPASDKMPEQFIINLETDYNNSSRDTE
jgi:hypothetical protein